MTKPTIQELKQYQAMQHELASIQAQIAFAYRPISSPPMISDGSQYGGLPGNPTERAVYQIAKLNRMYEEKLQEIADRLQQIEEWLSGVDDAEFRSIVRWHFMQGLSWGSTSKIVYGYYSSDAARKKFIRIYEKNCNQD